LVENYFIISGLISLIMPVTAVLIARFQQPEISQGIVDSVNSLLRDYDRAAIVLGINKTGSTRRNPIDGDMRKDMIESRFPGITVLTIEDHPSDEKWSEELDRLLEKHFGYGEFVVLGSDDAFVSHYKGKHNAKPTGKSYPPNDISAETLSSNKSSKEFRLGIVYGLKKTYPKVYPTVDIALFRDGIKSVLLGMKGAEKKWRFLGGFTDPDDGSFEDAVRRELQEECGLSDIKNLKYEASFRIDDWRYRYEEDKIITSFFSAEYVAGNAVGSDDIEEVRWFTAAEMKALVDESQIAQEHLPLFSHIIEKYWQ
jgi:bifunctional NMN adenylyltransferase/nudix hydrolase